MDDPKERPAARLTEIAGSVGRAAAAAPLLLGEVVLVGERELVGEVVALDGGAATLQIFEETTGLAPGDAVRSTGSPLAAELGPGLLGGVFDGLLRPLERLAEAQGDFLARGARAETLDPHRPWEFRPIATAGAAVAEGDEIGRVAETPAFEHRVLVPPGSGGRIVEVAAPGPATVSSTVARVVSGDGREVALTLAHRWPVRTPRPCRRRLPPDAPLVTGQRVLDTFFPVLRGGAAGMPGGFGTGKTVLQHQLCRFADADVIVFVGCGERGNEMTRLLRELPALADPRTGRTLAERTVIIANTSNMPVSAREASLHSGITVAEYFRDMGCHVALLADSTSRWAEALREVAGRLGEMPAEEGYPPYLSSRLASFYGRAGKVETLGGREGSVTVIAAVSPPAGDLSEPVTRHTQNFTRCFWALEKSLAEARHFPAVDVRDSYSEIPPATAAWWESRTAPDWSALRLRVLGLLAEADEVEATARLVGSEDLPPRERLLLRIRRLVEEGFLFQSAYDPADAYCSPERQHRLLRAFVRFADLALAAVERGASDRAILDLPVAAALSRARSEIAETEIVAFDALEERIAAEIARTVTAGGSGP